MSRWAISKRGGVFTHTGIMLVSTTIICVAALLLPLADSVDSSTSDEGSTTTEGSGDGSDTSGTDEDFLLHDITCEGDRPSVPLPTTPILSNPGFNPNEVSMQQLCGTCPLTTYVYVSLSSRFHNGEWTCRSFAAAVLQNRL